MKHQSSSRSSRSRALVAAILRARTYVGKAQRHYDFALFNERRGHQNLAIRHFEKSIRCGLPTEQKLLARLHMASNYLKSGFRADAKAQIDIVTRRRTRAHSAVAPMLQKMHRRLDRAA